jgi:D-alanyl-lipoteichoic acid acyltransferase DltB (MBOAT superfamily)
LFVQPFFLFVILPSAVGAFYLIRFYAGTTAALAVIVATSAIFYAPYGGLAAALLAVSLSLNLIIGIGLSKESPGEQWRRKVLLGIGLVLNFSALATFKYLDQVAALIAPSSEPILGVARA